MQYYFLLFIIMQQKLNDVKSYLRDIKLSSIFSEENVTIINEHSCFKPRLFYKNRKKFITQLKGLDGILVGSAALSMYRVNGVEVFTRTYSDLDFVVSRDNFIKFCGMNNFKNVKYTNTVVSLNFHTGKDLGTDSYGRHRGHMFHTDFDVIGCDDPISYNVVGDLKVESFLSIINNKLKLAEDYLYKYDNSPSLGWKEKDNYKSQARKHIDDLFEVITKIAANEGVKA